MANLPQAVRDIMQGGHEIWVATVGEDGWPNVAIKGTGVLLDVDTLYFADLYSKKTRENLLGNSRIAVGLLDRERGVAVQVKGVADMIQTGPEFERVTARLRELKPGLPEIVYVVRIVPDSVWEMTAGESAGEKIA